jgi:hypothetical protein
MSGGENGGQIIVRALKVLERTISDRRETSEAIWSSPVRSDCDNPFVGLLLGRCFEHTTLLAKNDLKAMSTGPYALHFCIPKRLSRFPTFGLETSLREGSLPAQESISNHTISPSIPELQ